MKFTIVSHIKARWSVEIEADSIEEAKALLEDKFVDTDFGESEEIEAEIHHIEDENGNYLEFEEKEGS